MDDTIQLDNAGVVWQEKSVGKSDETGTNMHPHDAGNRDAIKQSMELNGDPSKLLQYYEQWARAYDGDVSSEGYCGPEFITNLLVSLPAYCDLDLDTKNHDLAILDAGCGTGLVGVALAQKGYHQIDGCDLSPAMVEKARTTGAYRNLKGNIDLTEPNNMNPDDHYDVVICCGTFTNGHLPPEALEELVRMAKPQGLVLVSTRKSYYDSTDFETVSTRLQQENKVKLLGRVMDAPYIAEEGAHYFVFIVS